ncbi:DUF1254 domain-containing protein [Paenarthrobacter sp. OM7]|uniref:DUF1254 domain-containing protein n=1 Tax=Paenarthrobacter sp. AMU7 TaxID=3162492 RepID=A0AB39YM55_9MICC|nr:DUF1254 domain-containing protein [Paenarthrobacter sp. OM7]WGM20433.1 DUF1254 domain-containing protein [Paenarthrobacter sp. OM7]
MSKDPGLEKSPVELATEAFVYGFPLVFNLEQVWRYVHTGVGANPAAPFNTFSHAGQLAGPEDRFVTINNDTVYSMAQIDLTAGPLVLDVPDTGNRYYVLQFVSAWTENFAYVGKRATGTAPGRFFLVPPGWNGTVPQDATVIRFPTAVASIVGRWAVNGDADLAVVRELQAATLLAPLDSSDSRAGAGLPMVDTSSLEEALAFWEKYRVYSQTFAPPSRDLLLHNSFAPLGLTGDRPITKLPDDDQEILRAGYDAGLELLEATLRNSYVKEVNGWQLPIHVFDYNLDSFEVGTLNTAEWRLEDPDRRLITRASAALGGLWGNHAYEAAYFPSYVDQHGKQLSGEHDYTLTLNPPPPNAAFWSLTMYDVPNYYLVANPEERYSVGDRTPGLRWTDDGGLTIYISATEPVDPVNRANWLPAPAGAFRPMLRVYIPGKSVLTGAYVLPPIVKVR